jgi:transglutaminase-like putative cysteine protease
MRLNASCFIEFQSDQSVPVVLMLRPRSGAAQWIAREEYEFSPRVAVNEFTDAFGNLCQRTLIPAGRTTVSARCIADAADAMDVDWAAPFVFPENLPDAVLPFVLPSRYCPSDQMGALAAQITANAVPGYGQVEAIRVWIEKNIEYRYGTSTPATTALDTANQRVGVCRDFAHLGISLCRALNIPARMVTGYTEELKEPDLHAWFEAYVGWRWYCFDPTQEQTTGNRITMAYGRDATDVALVTQFGPLEITSLQVKVERENGTARKGDR